MPQRLDLRRLGEETVPADVHAAAAEHHAPGDAANGIVGFEHDPSPSELAELEGRSETGGAGAHDNGPIVARGRACSASHNLVRLSNVRSRQLMAKIVTVTQGLPSLVYPSVELARRLAAAGHRVTFAGDGDARHLVEHHGLEFLPLERGRYEAFLAADAEQSVLRRVLHVSRRRQQAADALAVDGFTRAMRDTSPDLILINGEMHQHIVSAAAAKMPVVLLNSFVSIWRQPGVPPPHHLARPGVGWRGTPAGASLLWENLRVVKWRKRLGERLRRVGIDRVAALRTLARRNGFDFARDTDTGQWLIPFTYRRLPVLSLHALEFEFSAWAPPHVHFVGPMVLESRIDRPQSKDDAARLAAIVARRQCGHGRKLIYAGFGSVLSTNPTFLRRLAGSVEERPEWDLVITLSNRIARASLEPVPQRVHVFDWVPQTELLRYCGCRCHPRRCQHHRRVRDARGSGAGVLRPRDGHGWHNGTRGPSWHRDRRRRRP